ncbi:uracil-DNA glycosylase [Desulforhopalus sp. IMCC35007]|uniref:uracil-DNA glycosylase n=1 Tax=Desulforhopalus sp. IMCC35007 TaxID=2569543 RepID=UPI0010AECB23|nr:uracil-DNA glycosylase [Desulforhopalus sp. IMCC35007]TKB06318.1 uracil-DNA glycosylase [Desulforhopalus sp. IMCC35007]
MADNQLDFYAGLQSLLKYHEEIGIDSLPLGDEIRKFLSLSPPIPSVIKPVESLSDQELPAAGTILERKETTKVSTESIFTIADIEKEVASCRDCELHQKRIYPVAGRGDIPVRLMIIGDWLSLSGTTAPVAGQLFGLQQDQMLFRMLAAMKIDAQDVFITNVIKCAISDTCQPKASHVQTCVGFLKKQIDLIRPQYICTMGMVAARAVLERSLPLSRLRGKFHDYTLPGGGAIPVLTTYHPSYLLQNPEMKKATWNDLQILAHKMGSLPAK